MRLIDADELYRAKFHGVGEIFPPDEQNVESYKRGWNDALDAVADESCTLTIEPHKWIPCSERLPKINEYVLAVFDHKNGVIDSIPLVSCYRPEVVDTTRLNENGEWIVTSRKNPWATIDGWYIREITDAPDGSLFRLWNCVAWMPLPEVYRGENDG